VDLDCGICLPGDDSADPSDGQASFDADDRSDASYVWRAVVLAQPGVIATPLYARAAAAVNGDDQARAPYRAVWPAGFGFPQRLLRAAASVDGIAATLARAALEPRPRARYCPGMRNRLNTRLLTTLPTGPSDRVKRRTAGLATSAPGGARP
jgi:hypothetical protein